ncbi:MAG: hypothetical protein FWE69_01710 [Clostridiales bacterium]|nr:hypothetical protein [Clostridiales bacterium]
MILSLLVTIVFALSGLGIASLVLSRQKPMVRIWFGLVIGLFEMTWLPSLFAFLIGFTLNAQLLGLAVAVILGGFCFFRAKGGFAGLKSIRLNIPVTVALLLIFLVGAQLFSTHILLPQEGGYYVGQTTYGDLAMHLGFITSIAYQGVFPPHYNIFPFHPVNYPFLCETSSATLLQFGANLRVAYLIPALYAYILVILGLYFFFEQWLRRKNYALFATLLFFVGSGFGFSYFFDLAREGVPAISKLLSDSSHPTSFAFIFDGFYRTPTNLPTVGLRWVNPIVDMLIPQRATLFGWAFLFPCLYLLHGFMFKDDRQNVLPLAFLAAGIPLIHTHSFLALGMISAVYFVWDLLTNFNKKRLIYWALFGGIAMALAAPQLFGFAFSQAAESGMVKIHLNWANEIDSFLWFYIKNLGWIFILLPFGYLLLGKRDRRVMLGALALWLVAECVIFQPNQYDNNKLLFVWFAYLCGLAAKLLGHIYRRARRAISKRVSEGAIQRGLNTASLALCGFLVGFFLFKQMFLKGDADFSMRMDTLLTMILLFGFLLVLQGSSLWLGRKRADTAFAVQGGFAVGLTVLLFFLLRLFYREYMASFVTLPRTGLMVLLFFIIAGFVALLYQRTLVFMPKEEPSEKDKAYAGRYVALQLAAYALGFTLFVGGVLTIVREWRSEYHYFGPAQIEAAAFVREETPSDAMFLTDYSWHINAISALTGRNIVCGPDLFLFFHGVNTSERHEHVRAMMEEPAKSRTIFEKYDVRYIYIGPAERSRFDCDWDFFDSTYEVVFRNSETVIYRVS